MKILLISSILFFLLAASNAQVADITIEGNQYAGNFAHSIAQAGDINGDGFNDIVIGASNSGNDLLFEGIVYVYEGTASGVSITPSTFVEGNQFDANLGFSVAIAGDLNGDGYDDIIAGATGYNYNNGAAFLYYGADDGIGALPSVILDEPQFMANAGYSVSGAGDVNGDGYDDLLVGIPNYDNGSTDEGIVRIYYGSASGISEDADLLLEANQSFAYFGSSVASAGDINNDGFDDIMIGAFRYDSGETDEGKVFIYYGTITGINEMPSVTLEINQNFGYFGNSLASADDINADGFDDIIIGAIGFEDEVEGSGAAFVYYGSADGIDTISFDQLEGNQIGGAFGCSVSSAGDMNNDGYRDIIIGSGTYTNVEVNEGRAFIYYGSETGIELTPGRTLECDQTTAFLGYCVATVDDINNDGFDDVVVGASSYTDDVENEGAAFIYFGDNCASSFYYSDTDGDGFGYLPNYMVTCTPMPGFITDTLDCDDDNFAINPLTIWYVDEDNDTYYSGTGFPVTQCLIPAAGYNYNITGGDDCNDFNALVNPGAPELFDGLDNNCDGNIDEDFSWTMDATLEGNQLAAFMGCSVASAGDINGDGFGDIISGAKFYDDGEEDEGAAFLFLGSPTGVDTIPSITLEPDIANMEFGYSVSSAGDLNGDGYTDIMIGVINYSNIEIDEGGIFVYYGSDTGISTIPDVILESNVYNGRLGICVASAGDVNADGYDDIVAGAEYYTNGQTWEGAAYIFLGSPVGVDTIPSFIFESNQEYGRLGTSVSSAGDINGDGFDDVIIGCYQYNNYYSNDGRAYIFYGSATGVDTTPEKILEGTQYAEFFGISVAGAGDINADGYDDIIVGAENYADPDSGAVFIYYGNDSMISSIPDLIIKGNKIGADFGHAVSPAGDINSDGFADVLVGANSYSHPEYFEGMAFIYPGSASGLIDIPEITMESDVTSSYFSSTVASAGDINGDGQGDIIIGAPTFANGDISEGAAFIYISACYDVFYYDADGDGFGISSDSIIACHPGSGYVGNKTDCDDTDPGINPTTSEICNSEDENCNGLIDEGLIIQYFFIDADGDNYGNPEIDSASCYPSIEGYVSDSTDCDDTNPLINPGMTEILNSEDDNCNGLIDEGYVEIGNTDKQPDFIISPNPNSGTFEINLQNLASANSPLGGQRGLDLFIYNSLGQLIYSDELISSTQTISLGNISSGIYFLRVGDGDIYFEKKIMIEK